jgi:hypothetical protein
MKTNDQRKRTLQTLQQEASSADPLQITSEEVKTLFSLLLKIGIRIDMKHRGVTGFEEYVDALLKAYPATTD